MISLPALVLAVMTLACKSTSSPTTATTTGINKVNHIVVLYLENHSFDNLYGEFAGANGLTGASNTIQVDSAGHPYSVLPQPVNTGAKPPVPDSRFSATIPNGPFSIETYVAAKDDIPDLVHRFYQEQTQIDGGKMDKFALVSDAKGLSMGYYHTGNLPLATEAHSYTLMDNFFHSAFGGSFLNHMWLIAAASPMFTTAPSGVVIKLDSAGHLVTDGFVTPDGYAVNTCYTHNTPHPASAPAANLLPNLTLPTIGDRLTAANVSWVWYSGGWNNALAGSADASFQYHHQPFAYFANYADNTPAKAAHLKDETDFMQAAAAGTLPAVTFLKPIGINNEHPGYTDVLTGERHVDSLINAVRNGPNWSDAVIIVTYDEHGGFWDHVAPPVIDRWGPGARVPTIIISPFAKKGFIDHTQYETVSILKFIEKRYGLTPLSSRDAAAGDLTTAFTF